MAQVEVPFDVPEEQIPPEGTYDLRIVMKEFGRNKDDTRDQHTVIIQIEDEADYVPIYHYLTWPSEEDWDNEPEKARNAIRRIKRFCAVFGIEFDDKGIEDDDLDGATGRCLVKLREYEGEDRPSLQLPRLKS